MLEEILTSFDIVENELNPVSMMYVIYISELLAINSPLLIKSSDVCSQTLLNEFIFTSF